MWMPLVDTSLAMGPIRSPLCPPPPRVPPQQPRQVLAEDADEGPPPAVLHAQVRNGLAVRGLSRPPPDLRRVPGGPRPRPICATSCTCMSGSLLRLPGLMAACDGSQHPVAALTPPKRSSLLPGRARAVRRRAWLRVRALGLPSSSFGLPGLRWTLPAFTGGPRQLWGGG
jgi:hypothetical protein